MKVILFGATGMVGQGVLRECLAAKEVSAVLAVGRTPVALVDPKLSNLVHADLWTYAGDEPTLIGYDACFFCLGVTSSGKSEEAYSHLTYDATLAAATVLARLNPTMVFTYVSGQGTDSSEKGRSMWARVKGRTENALGRLGFRAVYLFRPGFILPLHGIRSKTPSYQLIYSVLGPLIPLAKRLFPRSIVTTEEVGRAMLEVALRGHIVAVLEPKDIAAAAAAFTAAR